jgi:hypothetical protein
MNFAYPKLAILHATGSDLQLCALYFPRRHGRFKRGNAFPSKSTPAGLSQLVGEVVVSQAEVSRLKLTESSGNLIIFSNLFRV